MKNPEQAKGLSHRRGWAWVGGAPAATRAARGGGYVSRMSGICNTLSEEKHITQLDSIRVKTKKFRNAYQTLKGHTTAFLHLTPVLFRKMD